MEITVSNVLLKNEDGYLLRVKVKHDMKDCEFRIRSINSDEKIDSIFSCQLSEKAFREACQEVIDNNGSMEETFRQIDVALGNALTRFDK